MVRRPFWAKAIRRRIETLVPPMVGEWSKLAQKIRGEINERLDFGARVVAFGNGLLIRHFLVRPD